MNRPIEASDSAADLDVEKESVKNAEEQELESVLKKFLDKEFPSNIFARVNVKDAWRLLKDFHTGVLAKGDNPDGKGTIRRGGSGGSTLSGFICAWQVRRILRLMYLIRARPLNDLPERKGWWVDTLDFFQRRTQAPYFDANCIPTPSDYDLFIAMEIFCSLLYTECIKGN